MFTLLHVCLQVTYVSQIFSCVFNVGILSTCMPTLQTFTTDIRIHPTSLVGSGLVVEPRLEAFRVCAPA